MKNPIFARVITFVFLVCLVAPTTGLAFGDGKKYFKEGMRFERSEEWDKAAELFAQGVTEVLAYGTAVKLRHP